MSLLSLFHPWGWLVSPLPRPTYVTQGWAADRAKRNDLHRGMDFRAAVGTPTYATISGTVEYAEYGSATAGNWVGIRHPSGLLTRHLHLSEIFVQRGQNVSKGQTIGRTGNTGDSAGPHLHFDAELPPDRLGTFTSLFGKLPEGYGFGPASSFGVKVPAEQMIPADSYADDIIKFSMAHQFPLRGGLSHWVAVGGIAVVGTVAWKNRAAIKRRLGA